MKCPVDGETLLVADRSGVEIDYCPLCRGVWLDRGELDKILERDTASRAPAERPVEHFDGDFDDDDDDRAPHRHRGGRRPERREGFLSDIFDFF